MKDLNADLKKFITQTVLDSEMRLCKDFKTEINMQVGSLRQEFTELQTEMREGFAGIGQALDHFAHLRDKDMKYIGKTFQRHEREISVLQEQIAPLVNL